MATFLKAKLTMVRIERWGQADAGGTEFKGDPVADGGLQVLVVVRAHL